MWIRMKRVLVMSSTGWLANGEGGLEMVMVYGGLDWARELAKVEEEDEAGVESLGCFPAGPRGGAVVVDAEELCPLAPAVGRGLSFDVRMSKSRVALSAERRHSIISCCPGPGSPMRLRIKSSACTWMRMSSFRARSTGFSSDSLMMRRRRLRTLLEGTMTLL